MKELLLISITAILMLSFFSCEKHEVSTKIFTLNIDGKDYIYATKRAIAYVDKEKKYGTIMILAQNNEYGEFSRCLVNLEYNIQDIGTYEVTDLSTFYGCIKDSTSSKYAHISVNLGTDYEDDTAKYRVASHIGGISEAKGQNGLYEFDLSEPVTLHWSENLGIAPEFAPHKITLTMPRVHL